MIARWTIAGEEGKAFGPNQVPMGRLVTSGVATLTRTSAENDTLEWTTVVPVAEERDLPEHGQFISSYLDGIRQFTGVIASRPASLVGGGRVSVKFSAVGAWWFLEHTMLSDLIADDQGDEKERALFRFDKGSANTSFDRLIERAIFLGCPIQKGQISQCFDLPQITIANQSCNEALAELLRWICDAGAWLDYSASGNPKLNIGRRSDSENIKTLTVGVDKILSCEIDPRLGIAPGKVVVNAAEFDDQGKLIFTQQTSGEDNAASRKQIVTVSGPENESFSPPVAQDSEDVRTLGIGNTNHWATTKALNQTILSTIEEHGDFTLTRASGDYTVTSGPGTATYTTAFPSKYLDKEGAPVTSGYFAMVAGDYQEWMTANNSIGHKSATLDGQFYTRVDWANTDPEPDPDPWLSALIASLPWVTLVGGGVVAGATSRYYFFRLTTEVELIDIAYSSLTTIYRSQDFDYLTAPSDLATNLLAAQEGTPYSGSVSLGPDHLGQSFVGRHLNIVGAAALPQWSNMRSLVQSETIDLKTGITDLSLGMPDRLAFATLLNRLKSRPEDNVVQTI